MSRITSLVLASALAATPILGATFTVINTNDSGAGSYRQALLDANTNPGLDTIAFNVSGASCDGSGVCTIAPTAFLPSISSPVVIDGYTQPGSSPNTNAQGALNSVLKVVLSGANIPGQSAISISGTGAGSTVRGLVINGGFDYTVTSSFSDGDTLAGCFIGTDVSGMSAVPNGRAVHSEFGPNLRIGGPNPADRNLISGNIVSGIDVFNGANLLVEGNLIGTDITGAAPLGNNQDAVYIGINCSGTVVRSNVIADAQFNGLVVGDSNGVTHGITIQGNWIGTDVTGTLKLGNTYNGIFILGQQNAVGGIGPGQGNVIAFNGQAAVLVSYSTIGVLENPIRGNSIYGNNTGPTGFGAPDQGIDLGNPGGFGAGGLTLNDLDDADVGPNLNQNFPIITSAVSSAPTGGSTTITGRLNSTPNTTFTLDFYSNDACVGRPQEFREGQNYLGSADVTTDGGGDAAINVILPVALAAGEKVTATATDPDGNTSEFSQRIVVSSAPGSGSSAGAAITLAGFHFLSGATATVGGVPASNVVVTNYNQITAMTPALAPGSLNDVTVTNTDGSAGTLPNGWIADFLDMPGNQFYSFVTTLVRNAITVGVGGGNYGVAQGTKRQQMAVFLLKAKYGLCYTPPPCTGVFPDVPCSSNFAPWIEALAAEGVTTGCGGGLFCPDNLVTRRQMAVFLLKTKYGSSYVPPACAGVFDDVACPGAPAVDFIEQLAAEQITGGCSVSPPLYCPDGTSTRGQMAVFIVKTFSLQ